MGRHRRLLGNDDTRGAESDQFLRDRSQLAREEAVRNLELAVQRVANLVLNASALADRMQARRDTDLDGRQARQARVAALRDAASAGREAIGRATAELIGRKQPGATSETAARQDSSA